MPESGKPGDTFGRVAEAYARTRPSYAPDVIERAARELGLSNDATVLDLAAGTGVLTRALRAHFAHVLAVEPDEGMRAQFDGDVLAGTAEAIPLPDQSVDAVFVGDAFHWFDARTALAEIRRVASVGLAVTGHAWGIKEQPELLPQAFHDDLDAVWRRFHGDRTAGDFPDWTTIVQPQGPVSFERIVRMSGRDLVDLHLTASTPASITDRERDEIAARAYPLVDDDYDMRVRTELYWLRF